VHITLGPAVDLHHIFVPRLLIATVLLRDLNVLILLPALRSGLVSLGGVFIVLEVVAPLAVVEGLVVVCHLREELVLFIWTFNLARN